MSLLKKRIIYVSLFFFPFLFFTPHIYGRDITVYVEDADLEIALEGAVILAPDGKQFICDENGQARLPIPDDTSSVLTASYPGYDNGRLSIPSLSASSAQQDQYRIALRLSNTLSNKELIFTADKMQEKTQVHTGRSVTIAEKELARTAEIGLMEDVMSAVKLLPGVGYTSMFNAKPSIRGGDPGDLIAALDGFYIENPYFWGGAVSIFDPHMIEQVKLSHGIFSARYGRTISGLLELQSKKPSSTDTEIEFGISTSAVNLNVSVPINNKGGFMIMGKITYWDAYIALVKSLSYSIKDFETIRAVTRAPSLRAVAFSGVYKFSYDIEWTLNGFIGGDGVGASYDNALSINSLQNNINLHFDWENTQGFLISSLRFNPSRSMILKTTLGGGFLKTFTDGASNDVLNLKYDANFRQYMIAKYNYDIAAYNSRYPYYNINQQLITKLDDTSYTGQARLDYDWELGSDFLFAAGIEALYTKWTRTQYYSGVMDLPVSNMQIPGGAVIPKGYINTPVESSIDGLNQALSNAAFTTLEYRGADNKFGAELGLRLDHLYFIGRDFSIQTYPAFNPRLNLDYNLLRDTGYIDVLALTAGSGLFSSMTDNISNLQGSNKVADFDLKQNRSWTSLIGLRINFLTYFSFNIEAYYKYIFDRAYTIRELTSDILDQRQSTETDYRFDGEGRVWGFDLMLQKYHSKFIDGWISYTFNYALYRNPVRVNSEGHLVEGDWRFPTFHRFHNLNLVLTIKPSQRFNIGLRLGFASGTPLSEPGTVQWYPVLVRRDNEEFLIQKYKRDNYYSDTRRNGFSLPLDIKFSFFSFYKNGKTQCEVYLAVENALWFLKTKETNSSFDAYTGKEVSGSATASYQLDIPMISFGFTWTY
ncbi:MAG: TonB-dependent receptor plug domain-containing protein [Spirochaetaceae bacterium]|jgi:hypothetical protein|nr:TonB-dependent receptor plug domain-containing protein [Spirochaetaceae bacterium]